MINIGIAVGVMTLIVVLFMAGLQVHWAIALPIGVVAGFVTFFLLARKVQEKLNNLMAEMQRDLQEQKIDRAIQTLERGYSLKWQMPFMERQINSQIGMLHYIKKDLEKARTYLEKGFAKHYIGQGMLAAIYYKDKNLEKCYEAMDVAVAANKKEPFLYGLYAWFLMQQKDKEKATEKLLAGLTKVPSDERLKTNLNLIQNNKKMKMRLFGDMWVQFMLERPPRMQQAPPGHMRMSRKAMFR
jgi:tetratricopeptide (TPR) repeat protein